MKHAFSRIRPLLIQLLAYVLCTLCKTDTICIRTKGGDKFLHISSDDSSLESASERGTLKGVDHEQVDNEERR